MKKSVALYLALLFVAGLTARGSLQQQKTIQGIWQGVLETSGIQLRIVFKISRETDSSFTATMDSPDQGATDIPVDRVTLSGDSVTIQLLRIGGIYQGKIAQDGSEIQGVWKQSGYQLPLTLRPSEKAPEIRRPQEPKKTYPYEEEEISYTNEKTNIMLAGTLTHPPSEGPFPAVLLITGSGPQDRNETVFGHKPFLVLADYLTRRGIAVLRVDDRGVGGSTGDILQSTAQDFARDVLAGIEYLRSRNEIHPKRIGLIGHSEGGIVAPMVAVQSPDVAFVVLMAGTGLPGEEILYLQSERIGKANGASDEAIAKNRAFQEQIFHILRQEEDAPIAREKIRELYQKTLAEMSDEDQQALGQTEKAVESQTRMILSPWFRFFLTHDPTSALRKVRCPVLALIGEKDLQVPPQENLAAIAEALRKGGNPDYTVEELPGLNHLFQTAETGSPTEYARIEETLSPVALKVIGDWILERVGKTEE